MMKNKIRKEQRKMTGDEIMVWEEILEELKEIKRLLLEIRLKGVPNVEE